MNNAVRCDGCPALVVWTLTEKNKKRMCVDAEPTLRGNLVLMHQEVGRPPVSRAATKEELARRDNPDLDPVQRVLFTSHFATCPAASTFRRRGA